MKITRNRWSAGWFDLARHDDPNPTPEGDPDPGNPGGDPEGGDPDPEPDPEGADQLGAAGKKALERMKAERAAARREAAAAKKAAEEAQAKVQEYEDRDKSELEKAQATAERATERAAKATARAVEAEVKAMAGDFTDVDDALVNLRSKLTGYAGDDGEIDTEAIAADLAEVLERKPHLKKQTAAPEPEKKPGPKPDPSQGPRPSPAPTDYRTADKDALKARLAEVAPGFKLRQ